MLTHVGYSMWGKLVENINWYLLSWKFKDSQICNLYSMFVWTVILVFLLRNPSQESQMTIQHRRQQIMIVLCSSPLLPASWLWACWEKWMSIFCHFAACKKAFTYWACVRMCIFIFPIISHSWCLSSDFQKVFMRVIVVVAVEFVTKDKVTEN